MADEQGSSGVSVKPVNQRKREPATFYGEKMLSGQPPYASPYPQGPLEAAGRSFKMGLDDVAHRWASMSGSERTVTQDEYQEIIGDSPVDTPWSPSMTQERAEFLADEGRRRRWMQQFENRPVAQFLGEALPTVADPISVATMPVGGTSFKAASEATSLKQFLKSSTAGGAKVGAATAPIEAAAQPTFYGETRPAMIAGTAIAPVAASPLLSLPGYALRSIAGRQSGIEDPDAAVDMAEAAAHSGQMDADVSSAASRLTDEEGDLPAPPMGTQAVSEQPDPRAELDRMFGDWQGSERGWVRDLAAGDRAAAQRAREMGVDPDSPALRDFLRKEGRRSDMRSRAADEDRFTQARDFDDFVKGRATPEQKQRLAANGLIESAESAKAARQTPEDWRLGEVLRQAQEADAREAEVRELGTAPHMRPVQEALEADPARRTASQRETVRAFTENGAGAARNVEAERLRRRYDDLLDQEARVEEEIAEGRQQYRDLEQVRKQRSDTYRELDALEDAGRVDQDGQFDMGEFLYALDAARMESESRSRWDTASQPQDNTDPAGRQGIAAKHGDDPEIEAMREYAEKRGADADAVDAEIQRYTNHVLEC